MERIVSEHRVPGDGMLRIVFPLGAAEAGREVRVTIEPLAPSPEAWRAAILATAGAWQGEFESPPSGAYEERDSLS